MNLQTWMQSPGRLLVCTAAVNVRRDCAQRLESLGFEVHTATDRSEALARLIDEPFDVCWLEPSGGGPTVDDLIDKLVQHDRSTCVIRMLLVDAPPDNRLPIDHNNTLPVACTAGRLLTTIYAAVAQARLAAESQRLHRQHQNRILRDMVGHSPAIQHLRRQIQQAADCDLPVLICGEPGAGLKLAARSIHDCSRRAYRPFVKVDCRVMTAEALEQQLFGRRPRHEWEAAEESSGLLASADGGTLLLDNIDAAALGFQRTLARVLKQQPFDVFGPSDLRPLTVRLLTTTRIDLPQHIERGLFRRDLYGSLGPLQLVSPPLRERREDVSLLCEHFLNRLSVEEGRPPRRIAVEALELLIEYNWPGNVRELQQLIARACSLDLGAWLTADLVRPWLIQSTSAAAGGAPGLTLKDMERKLIEATFARHGGNRERTAQDLQIGLRTLSGKLREFGYPPRGGPGSNQNNSSTRAA